MNLEDFQILDNTQIDNKIVTKDFLKYYHQQRSQLNDPNQNAESIFGERNNYHQSGNSYLEFEITVPDQIAGFKNNTEKRLVIYGFAFCFKEATVSSAGGIEIEHVRFFGQLSTNMRSLTIKDGDLLSYFDNINDTDENTSMKNNSIKDID